MLVPIPRPTRNRLSDLTLQIEALDRGRALKSEIAVKAFELLQTLSEKSVAADSREKHLILEII